MSDYERAAEERLDPASFGYFAGGANDEWTLRENVAAFGRCVLRPRMLVDVSTRTTATTVLGTDVACPVLVAPVAFQGLAHPDAEKAMARGAAAAGTVMCLSTLSTASLEEVAEAAPEGALVPALLGPRTVRSCRTSSSGPEPPDIAPSWSPSTCRSSAAERDLEAGLRAPSPLSNSTDDSLTWRDLGGCARTTLPILVKGILTAEDAALALEAGAEGIVVSNHGGRQLDGVAASLDALPEVVEAAGDRAGPPRRRHPARDRRRRGARARRSSGSRGPGGALRPRGRRRRWRGARPRTGARRGRARAGALRVRVTHDVTRAHVGPAVR